MHLLFRPDTDMLRLILLTLFVSAVPVISAAQDSASSSYNGIADGWRRTEQGWENTRTWDLLLAGSAIGGSLYQATEQQEHQLIRFVSSMHPLAIASVQCVLALSLMAVGTGHWRKERAALKT